jgi:hypothetical protein
MLTTQKLNQELESIVLNKQLGDVMKNPVVVLMIGDTNRLALDISKHTVRQSNGGVTCSSYLLDTLGHRTDMTLDPVSITNLLCVDRVKDYVNHSKSQQYALPLFDETPVILAPVSGVFANEVYKSLVDYPRVDLRLVYINQDNVSNSQKHTHFLEEDLVIDTMFTSNPGKLESSARLMLDQVKLWGKSNNRLNELQKHKPLTELATRALKAGGDAINSIKQWQKSSREMRDDAVEILVEALHETHGDISQFGTSDQHGILLTTYAAGGLLLSEFEQASALQLPLTEVDSNSTLALHLDVAQYAYNAEIESLRPHTIEEHRAITEAHRGFFDYTDYTMPSTLRNSNVVAAEEAIRAPVTELEDAHITSHKMSL